MKFTVDAAALGEVLRALNGAGHLIRELQVTRGPLFENPIDKLIAEYNEQVEIARPAAVMADGLKPVEIEDGRMYIPLPGGWEVQTKGKGSSFRICHVRSQKAGDYERWNVTDERLHKPLEAMALAMREGAKC